MIDENINHRLLQLMVVDTYLGAKDTFITPTDVTIPAQFRMYRYNNATNAYQRLRDYPHMVQKELAVFSYRVNVEMTDIPLMPAEYCNLKYVPSFMQGLKLNETMLMANLIPVNNHTHGVYLQMAQSIEAPPYTKTLEDVALSPLILSTQPNFICTLARFDGLWAYIITRSPHDYYRYITGATMQIKKELERTQKVQNYITFADWQMRMRKRRNFSNLTTPVYLVE